MGMTNISILQEHSSPMQDNNEIFAIPIVNHLTNDLVQPFH